jgi:hypothetical protein
VRYYQNEDWPGELQRLQAGCVSASITDADAVLQFAALIEAGPTKARELLGSGPSADRIARLLDCGAAEQAAFELVRGRLGMLIATGTNGQCSAVICHPTINGETSFFGERPVLALVAAASDTLIRGFAVTPEFEAVH